MRYETLDELLVEDRNWSLRSAVSGIDFPDRARVVEAAMMEAVDGRDDDAATLMFTYLIAAINDSYLYPYVSTEDGVSFVQDSDGAKVARADARQHRANTAIRLYGLLPESRPGPQPKYADQETPEAPVLLGTKLEILVEVACQWRDTPDKEEADRLFDFLRSVPLRFDKDQANLLQAMRAAMDHEFPLSRLVRHLCALVPARTSSWDPHDGRSLHFLGRDRAIAEVLSKGFARSEGAPMVLSDMLRIALPLAECTGAAHSYVAQIAAKTAEFDAEIREVLHVLQAGEPFVSRAVDGEIGLAYDSSGVTITVTQLGSGDHEAEWDRKWTDLKDLIGPLLRESGPRVKVVYRITRPSDGEEIYRKKQTLRQRESQAKRKETPR